MLRELVCAGLVLGLGALAHADERAACAARAGTLLTGVVTTQPRFVHGRFRQGVELSHTRFTVQGDADQRLYDVAVDNVFASGYRKNSKQIPAPLTEIAVGDRVELCGALYTRGVGIHFVHTNCGDKPTPQTPDGWLKLIAANGAIGDNLEGSTQFCRLF